MGGNASETAARTVCPRLAESRADASGARRRSVPIYANREVAPQLGKHSAGPRWLRTSGPLLVSTASGSQLKSALTATLE
ncbi:MAG: hypothetical protein QOD02_5366 [Mycobacterium sp.]|nr:hypothetical protein [Mycobacterium sp.]